MVGFTKGLTCDVAEDCNADGEAEQCEKENVAEVKDLSCPIENLKSCHGSEWG